MKKFFRMLIIFLLLPVMVFVGCKNSKTLPSIALAKYLENEVTVKRNNFSEIKTEDISILTQKKANKDLLSQYIKFEIKTDHTWIYKMYIEKISFYVYCNESSESLMTINLKITDVATEDAIWNSTQETVESEDFESQCTFTPEANNAIKCNFKIERTVIVATGSTISIDIENCLELYSSTTDMPSTFMWMIYGLEINGESRTYTR